MRHFGSTAGPLQRFIRAGVARQYPSVPIQQQILTPYQEEQAKAGQFYLGSANTQSWWATHKDNPGVYIPLIVLAVMWLKK